MIEKKSLAFLITLAQVIRNRQMYNENHPVVSAGMETAISEIKAILASVPSIIFGKGDDMLLIQNKKITDKNIIAEQFLKQMSERQIGKVTINRGVTARELELLVTLMSTKPDHVLTDGSISPEFLINLNNIEVSEVEFLRIDEDELEALTEARKFLNDIFQEEFEDFKGAEAIKQIGNVIKKILPQLIEQNFENEGEELWEFFEKSIESFGGGNINATKESLKDSVKTMDPEIQKMLFGNVVKSDKDLDQIIKKFSGERKANIIAEEVAQGKNLSETLDNLVTENGDIVKIAEEIAKKFGIDDENSQTKLNQIFNLMQQLDRKDILTDTVRGKVIIADVDELIIKEFESFFKQLHFDIEIINDGNLLLEKLKKEKPDLVVMEAKLPEMSGLEVLRNLDDFRVCIPTIVCTTMESARDSFEIKMHRKLQFFIKENFLVEKMLPFVDEHCPPIQIDLPEVERNTSGATHIPEELKAELKKAREIQRNLMPKDFPQLEGLEVYSYYKAYDMIGGDYFDVIQIDDNNIGFLVADVSGHGITGAMVMVMVRSAVHTWAKHCVSPKELLAKVNPMVSRDILPGFFCTVYYAILNLEERKLLCSCAGHNPAVLWRNGLQKCEETKKGGMPLGILSGNAFERTLQEEIIQLDPGDRVIFYTDGLVETMDVDQEEYGEEKLFETIKHASQQRSDVFTKYVISGVLRHQNTAPMHDDLTMLTLRVL